MPRKEEPKQPTVPFDKAMGDVFQDALAQFKTGDKKRRFVLPKFLPRLFGLPWEKER